MIAHQKLGLRYCHKRVGAGQTERVITRNIIPRLLLKGFGKTWRSCALVVYFFISVPLPDALTSSGHFYVFMSLSGSVLAPPPSSAIVSFIQTY